MRDTRVHLNNFYICGATNQEINVTPFARMGRGEGGVKKMERWKELRIKLSKWDVEAAVAACLGIPLNFRHPSSARERMGKGREALMNNLCR